MSTRSNLSSSRRRSIPPKHPRARILVVCLENEGYEASLERRKFYVALPDAEAEQHRLVRVVDESGEHYLFPASYFAAPELTPTLRKRLLAAV